MEQVERSYHISGITNDEMRKLFCRFEALTPYPASVVPNIPQGEQLATIDKLAQSVIPKLVDKLNDANWKIERLTALCQQQQAHIDSFYQHIHDVSLPTLRQLEEQVKALAGKPKRTRKKKEQPAPELEIDISETADYDPDTDTWVPMTIDGQQITGALLDTVKHLGAAASQMYSEELLSFINNLDEPVKAAIAQRFPN